jgi:nitrogen-specific signal transduction histidine kinase/ActR/RegA family two-component response regulator
MPVQNTDGSISKLTIYRDITEYLEALREKEQVEAQLRQAQKLESIGNLAGGIAHDFNNVLASVIGFTELALDAAAEGSPQQEDLRDAYKAGMRAKELVTQILTFAKKTNEEVKPITMSDLINESTAFLRSIIPADICLRVDNSSESQVMGNPALLQQVIMNLVTNSMGALERTGGNIEVSGADVTISEDSVRVHPTLVQGDYVKITVSDDGSGIAPDVLDRVFEPYFTTKGPGKGTGMGLATVYGTVKKYGGSVTVESQQGEGTVFTVLLPAAEAAEEVKPHQTDALPKGTEHILFVDDEETIVKYNKSVLEKLGYTVTTETSSARALELFQAAPDDFDLVLSDMTMPHLTGDRLAVEMLKIRPDIPIIICTGFSSIVSGETAAEFGIKAFAYKPIVRADLAQTVRRVLDSS